MIINTKTLNINQDCLIEKERVRILKQSGEIFFKLRKITIDSNLQLSIKPSISFDLDVEDKIYRPRYIINLIKNYNIDISILIPLNKEFDLDDIILDVKKKLLKILL